MFRRQFVKVLAAVGTGSLASIMAAQAEGNETVTYRVKGFSCVTCAVGLDAMLKQEKGVTWSKSSYPDAIVIIKFDPKVVNEKSLKAYIAEMGFTVEEERAS
ncbi:MAG: heavy-metal-associated domain-containing protein [Candidatus Sulfotelmatobacter sp.]